MRIFVYEQFPNEKTPLGFTKKQVLMEGIYDGESFISPIHLYDFFRKNYPNWPKAVISIFQNYGNKYIVSTENPNIWAEVIGD